MVARAALIMSAHLVDRLEGEVSARTQVAKTALSEVVERDVGTG